MSPLIKKYYNNWINGTKLFGDLSDERSFYAFVKACLRYSRKPVNGYWLREHLVNDLKEKYVDEYKEMIIDQATSLFDHFVGFHKTNFPWHVLEKRNPYLVMDELLRTRDHNNKQFYSDEEIENTIVKYFGSDWRKKYR